MDRAFCQHGRDGRHGDAVFFFDQPEQFLGMETFRQIIPGSENEKIPFRCVIFHAEDHTQAVGLKTLLYVRLRGHVIVIRNADSVKPSGTCVGEDLNGSQSAAGRIGCMNMHI